MKGVAPRKNRNWKWIGCLLKLLPSLSIFVEQVPFEPPRIFFRVQHGRLKTVHRADLAARIDEIARKVESIGYFAWWVHNANRIRQK